LLRVRFAVVSPRDIENLAPIHRRHQEGQTLTQSFAQEFLNFLRGTLAILEKSAECVSVEHVSTRTLVGQDNHH
jgi:hypothetical protein